MKAIKMMALNRTQRTGPIVRRDGGFALVTAMVVLLLVILGCLREAGRYVRYQTEELVATIAAARAKE